MIHQKEANKRQLENSTRGTIQSPPYWKVFKACFPQCFNTFLIFFVTLALFPSVHSDIKSLDENFVVPSIYYSSIMCFLTFNITAMLGSSVASIFQWVCNFVPCFSFQIRVSRTYEWCFIIRAQYLYSVHDYKYLIHFAFLQPSKKYLVIPVILRLAYLPLFLLCNYQPANTVRILPVFIHNDWIYFAIAVTMGFSSGYLSSLSMMYCPKYVLLMKET